MRQSHKGVKTRVTINPGDPWPALIVRKDSQSSYVKIDDDMYEAAKAKVIQQSRSKSEQRRKRKRRRIYSKVTKRMMYKWTSGKGHLRRVSMTAQAAEQANLGQGCRTK